MEIHLFQIILSIKRKCQLNEDKIQEDLQLTPGEFNGLLALNADELILGSHFSERMGLSPSRGSRILTRLIRKKFVKLNAKPEDRRSVIITLTPAGLNMKTKIEERLLACEKRICASLSENQVNNIKKALKKLEEVL